MWTSTMIKSLLVEHFKALAKTKKQNRSLLPSYFSQTHSSVMQCTFTVLCLCSRMPYVRSTLFRSFVFSTFLSFKNYINHHFFREAFCNDYLGILISPSFMFQRHIPKQVIDIYLYLSIIYLSSCLMTNSLSHVVLIIG